MLDLIHYSKKARDTLGRLKEFLKEHVYPVEMVIEKKIFASHTNSKFSSELTFHSFLMPTSIKATLQHGYVCMVFKYNYSA